ncbi:inositol monophosphatase [Virgisporangium aliadipatigenens]|uniref:Inositol-1-monophosphatase n=1 Tax=Virgisporangium aliadipatigenens TaxID=741659 RepID=A0A8J3YTY0_9ACTN|nr:inositol monophosphatase family protein [Virgisporangium aliadipatigenens]GIJ51844.1 inositol monophosphatase [Virgisporangium aliadipatigenens]
MATEPAELLTVALGVAREAADLALRMRTDGVTGIDTKSTITDVVTAADKAVEDLVKSSLQQLRPGDAVLGEETGGAAEPSAGGAVRWIVDPIDGTVNYLYGLPQYAVSLAAEVDGVVVAGVVRNPVTGQEWTAVRGGGAWRAGRRLTCSAQRELGLTLIATGFGYDARRRAHQAAVISRVLPRVRDIRRFGAASLDLCLAAEGAVDAYFEKGLAAWDRAAGGLIAEEAGLRVTGLRGEGPGRRFVLAANEAVYEELHDLLVEADADGGP